MGSKSEYLQIRVTPAQKAALKRHAATAAQDLSSYVLARSLPPAEARFAALLASLQDESDSRYLLAELNDFLSPLEPEEVAAAVARADLSGVPPVLANYAAAMVDQACQMKGVALPAWLADVPPLETPYFATSLRGLRLHLLRASPVPFKRRNIFVDATVGARV